MNKSQLLNKLFILTKTDATVESFYKQFETLFADAPEVFAAISSPENREKLINSIKESYAAHFSIKEISGLIEFYESNLGQKYLEKTPQIMAEVAQAAESLAKEVCESLGY